MDLARRQVEAKDLVRIVRQDDGSLLSNQDAPRNRRLTVMGSSKLPTSCLDRRYVVHMRPRQPAFHKIDGDNISGMCVTDSDSIGNHRCNRRRAPKEVEAA